MKVTINLTTKEAESTLYALTQTNYLGISTQTDIARVVVKIDDTLKRQKDIS